MLNTCVKGFVPTYLNKLFLQLFSIVMVLIYYLSIMWQVWHFFKDSSHMKLKTCLFFFFFVIETSNQVGDE